ncbi:hypothetical protein Tco_1260367, partial [Tanacetum coccineum]
SEALTDDGLGGGGVTKTVYGPIFLIIGGGVVASETTICSKEKKLHADGRHQFPPNKGNIPLTSDMIQHLSGRVNVSFTGDIVEAPSPRVTNREHTHVTRRTDVFQKL